MSTFYTTVMRAPSEFRRRSRASLIPFVQRKYNDYMCEAITLGRDPSPLYNGYGERITPQRPVGVDLGYAGYNDGYSGLATLSTGAIIDIKKEYQYPYDKVPYAIEEVIDYLLARFDVISVEDLSTLHNPDIYKEQAYSLSTFASKLVNEAITRKSKCIIMQVPAHFMSTKKCHNCGNGVQLAVSDRSWRCPWCRVVNHRDLNAAINIGAFGLYGAYQVGYLNM